MNDRELEALLIGGESDRVERKESLSDIDHIRRTVCAFANDLPDHRKAGVLFIGAKNDGSCAGLVITDPLLLKLADIRSDGNILPMPVMTVQKKTVRGCQMAVVTVEASYSTPVRYNGRIWVRVGPTTRLASPEDERRLTEKRRAHDVPFDIQPVQSASLDDLDLHNFRRVYLPLAVSGEILEENERATEQQLTSLRFATVEPQPQPKPTTLGILVVGKDPREFFPGAYIQFLRVDGAQWTDPIKDQKEIDGPLPDLLRMLDEVFRVHISVASDFTHGTVELQRPDYPLVALQQLARNAVLHRTYEGTNAPVRIAWFSDRIEIQNPGGPFGQVSKQNFGQPGVTDYRNPHLAEAMRILGYVQRFGIGIQLARKELDRNGNPPPEFDVQDAHILVTVRK